MTWMNRRFQKEEMTREMPRKSSFLPTLIIGALVMILALVRTGAFSFLFPGTGKPGFKTSMIEPYQGEPAMTVNEDLPFFTDEDRKAEPDLFQLGEFDGFHRVTPAIACLGLENMPTDFESWALEEGDPLIPSGWKQARYECIPGEVLYLVCPLIPWSSRETVDYYENRMTGTRDFFEEGLKPCLEEIRKYIQETEQHVLFRATPVYEGLNLLSSGVLIEAESLEDGGEGLQFCRYIYNVQPGIAINYLSGSSFLLEP